MNPAGTEIPFITVRSANELRERESISVAETLTGDGGYVIQFVLVNVGEQRLQGVIPHNMAALGYKTSSALDSSNTEYVFVKTEDTCWLNKNILHT